MMFSSPGPVLPQTQSGWAGLMPRAVKSSCAPSTVSVIWAVSHLTEPTTCTACAGVLSEVNRSAMVSSCAPTHDKRWNIERMIGPPSWKRLALRLVSLPLAMVTGMFRLCAM